MAEFFLNMMNIFFHKLIANIIFYGETHSILFVSVFFFPSILEVLANAIKSN